MQVQMRPLRWIHRKLGNEATLRCEFDDLARLLRVGVDRVAVRREQIAVRSERQCQRAMQIRVVRVDQDTLATIVFGVPGAEQGEDGIVDGRSDIEHVSLRIVCQSARTDDARAAGSPRNA
jgi:hypothetical protein